MKSIKEWMKEKGMGSFMEDDMTKSMYVKSKEGSLEVDPVLRSRLSQFIDRIKQMEKYRDLSDLDLASKIHDAVDAVVADVSGSKISADVAFDKMHDDPIAKEAP